MNLSFIYDIIATVIATGVGAFFGWFFTRKKQNIDTIDAAIDTWQKVVDSLENQVQKQLTNIECLRNEKDSLSSQVHELLLLREKDSKEIQQLKLKVEELSTQLKAKDLKETLIEELKIQIEEKNKEIASLKSKTYEK